jgi:putative hydrolase of the HAD superfamily
MSTQAIIFDRDNTLVQFDAAAIAALEQRIAAIAPTLARGAAVRHWTTWPGPWPRTPADEAGFWHMFWADLAHQHGLSKAAVGELQQIGAFYHTCFTAFPDSLDCLTTLRDRGLRLAVLSNFELPSIQDTLRTAGLDPSWFDVLLSSATIGCHKPDPRAYLAAAKALGLAADECAFVDDLPENVAVAHHLGMYAVLLDRRQIYPPDLPSIRSLDELPKLLHPAWMSRYEATASTTI